MGVEGQEAGKQLEVEGQKAEKQRGNGGLINREQ
jgi:hypothetical protein